jgi:hypothetical protein
MQVKIKDVPELRIVEDTLWQAVKARQGEASKRAFPKAASRDGVDAAWSAPLELVLH